MNALIRSIPLLILLVPGAPLFAGAEAPFDKAYAAELLKYLYRWHMDDAILSVDADEISEIELYFRESELDLDPGDNSTFLEVILPIAQMEIVLKKASYEIPKKALTIKSDSYKFVSAQHYKRLDWEPADYTKLTYDFEEIFNYLYEHRNEKVFPDEAVRERLRAEVMKLLREKKGPDADFVDDALQVAYLAPISPVTNDLWVYYVNGHMLLHFTSDLDYTDPAYWDIAPVNVDIVELKEEVIVAAGERGGTGFFSKDYAGRILFNCLVHGQEIKHRDEAP